eukprot:TRINITY_DN16373_c0_g1_i1.p1 TRINITY_DN16373_c0_g1~~TRINITY_DN16373_c0_g1_i1.p1  ORF type:complete len:234 (+),score=38.05 TRINITY_DN16373_c0_g1_i1:81-782(+)
MEATKPTSNSAQAATLLTSKVAEENRGGIITGVSKVDEATESDRDKLRTVYENLRVKRDIFSYAGDYYARCYYRFVIPSIVMTTLVSIVSAVWPKDEYTLLGKVLVSSFSGLATMMTSLLSLMKYQSKMDMFLSSASQMDALINQARFLFQYQVDGHVTRDMASSFIKEAEKKTIEIRANAPPLPFWITEQAITARKAKMEALQGTAIQDFRLHHNENERRALLAESGQDAMP